MASSTTPNTSLKRHSVLSFVRVQVFDKFFLTIISVSGKSPGRLLFVQHLSTTFQVTTVLCCVFFFFLPSPQELAGLFPFFATNINNSTSETTRGRQKSRGLFYYHLHPCGNLSSCQSCTCLRTVFHCYYKVVSLLGRRGRVKSLFWCVRLHPSLTCTNAPLFLAFLFPPIFNIIRFQGTWYGLQIFENLSYGRQITLVLPGPKR